MGILASWGRIVHRRRWIVLALSALLLAGSVAALLRGGTLASYETPANTQSGEAARLVAQQVPGAADATFVLVLSHPTWSAHDPAFRDAVNATIAPLRNDTHVSAILTPYSASPEVATSLVSRDGHRVLAVVTMGESVVQARDDFGGVYAKVHSDVLEVHATDQVAVYHEINQVLQKDLQRSELVALPLVLILLLIVFGTIVGALLPIGVGALSVMGGMAGVFVAARYIDVSVYAINIVSLIGLGVAIDYSLFIVSRFREELARGRDASDALARTMETAGRATMFSGLTVAIGLGGLAFYRGLYFATMGMGGAIVVTLAVAYSITFLAAILAILGPRVNAGRLPLPRPKQEGKFWHDLAQGVMKRPVTVLVPVLAVLLVAGIPFLSIHLASGGVSQLPAGADARVGYELLRDEFPGGGANPMTVVVEFPDAPLSPDHVGAVYDVSRAIASIPHVTRVQSVVDLDPNATKAQYQAMYAQPRASLPPPVQQLAQKTVGSTIVVLHASTDTGEASDEARQVVRQIRALPDVGGGHVLVTGATPVDVDTIDLVYKDTPIAVGFIVVTTYVLLLFQTQSVILPVKALAMNLLSISASFGALVWIFQQGHLSGFLGFQPAPIDPSIPVLLFCIVFGLSMDYEVLLLSRMHEEYERTKDNTRAVALGLERTGRLITSAALIMVLVFAAFALAQVTVIKAIGLGLAIAVAVDATLVRALVVPAAMRLMGDWNWWNPWKKKERRLAEFSVVRRP